MRDFRYAALGMFLLLIGCNIQDIDLDNVKIARIQPEFAVPFGTASYTMRELIEDASDQNQDIMEDSDTGEIRLIFFDTATYTFSPDIFDVPNVSSVSNVNLPDSPDNGMTRTVNVTIPFFQTYESADGEIIDSVFHATTSSLTVELVSTSLLDIDYDLELENTTDVNAGVAVLFSGTLSGGAVMNHSQGLANHKTIFTEVAGENNYNVNLTVDITLSPGQSLTSDQISVTINFLDQDFIIAFGKLGQDTVDIAGESINIAFFDDLGVDGLEFDDPEITFDFRSSFGMPIGVGFGGVHGLEDDGTSTFLAGAIVNTPPVIGGASTEHPVTGDIQQTTIVINPSNSSIRDVLATSPTQLVFDVQGFTNPFDPSILNFVTDTSSITSFIELEMPLAIRMMDVQHTHDFDIAGTLNLKDADSISLRVITVNELPFAVTMDMHILDAAEDTLYTVLERQALDVPFQKNGIILEPKTSIDDIPFDADGIEALNSGETIRVIFTMNTPESLTSEDLFVKLLATAKLDVTLAARFKIDVGL